jgi:hypothetical protein
VSGRKPPGQSWRSWIDQHIRQAQEAGEFDDLPGKGKPLAGLNEVYDPDWWAKKLIAREKVSLLPPALVIRRRVEKEIPRILRLRREQDVRIALGKLNAEISRTNRTVHEGPPTTVSVIDEDEFVARWREGQ